MHEHWEGDSGTLSYHSRRALVQLLKGPLVTEFQHPNVWRAISSDEPALRQALNNVFLELVYDEEAGIAFTRPAGGEDGALLPDGSREPIPAVLRTESLSHMDTLILLHLRQELMQAQAGERTIIDREDLRGTVMAYRMSDDRDESNLSKRFGASFKRIESYSLLRSTETEGRYEVSPALKHIFDADMVTSIKTEYEKYRSPDGSRKEEEEQE